jgi:PAS domain S-box-containing protein
MSDMRRDHHDPRPIGWRATALARVSRAVFAVLFASLWLGGAAPLTAQSAKPGAIPAPDTAALAQRLATATGAARIPLLLALADANKDAPAIGLPFADEALALLTVHPSVPREVEARITRSYALQSGGTYPEALAEALRAESLATSLGDARTLADAHYEVSLVQWRMADYVAATASIGRARRLLEPYGDSPALARTLSHVGAIHYNQSDLAAALDGFVAALRMSETLGDEIAAARAHNNIGLVYLDLGRTEDGYAALRRALAIHERLGPRRNLTNTLNNVGLALIELGRPSAAIGPLERAYLLDVEDGNLYGQAKDLSNIGYAHERMQQPTAALDYHRRALALRERIGDKDGVVRSQGAVAEVRMRLGDPRGAIPLFERSVALAQEINSRRSQSDLLALLSEAQAATGDSGGALRTYQRYHALATELADSAKHRLTAEIETRYQARQRQADLDALAVLAESRRERLVWSVATMLALVASLVLLLVLYTTRVRAERAVVESEQRYRALFQTSMVPFLLVDASTRTVLECNGPARTLCGVDSAMGTLPIAAIDPRWLADALARLLEGPDTDHQAIDAEWEDPAGRAHWSEVRGSRVTSGGRSCVLVSVRDTTEEHQEEEARQRDDKLQSLGVLAGGIAHDFNNALTAILGHVTLARDAEPDEREEMLAGAEQAAMAASHLTTQLLAFAKGGQPLRRTTDVARVLRDAIALAGAGSHMRIDIELPESLWHAHLDAGQFSQVVSNLVLNAAQATGEGGRLVVRASNVAEHLPLGAAAAAPASGSGAERYVRIDFADNGNGIPEAIRHRVFDPYFTTKRGGNGLGLATAFAICRNHGGTLTFTSRVGEGTTFSAFFPASSEMAAEATPEQVALVPGNGSILVLDDEPLVRSVLQRMLEQLGYRVESVAEGRAAVERFTERRQAGSPFDLLVMDLTIPGGMGGRQAMAEILRIDPSARAIVASGYSDDPTMAHFREAGFVAALTKPFQREALAPAVQAALHRPGDDGISSPSR